MGAALGDDDADDEAEHGDDDGDWVGTPPSSPSNRRNMRPPKRLNVVGYVASKVTPSASVAAGSTNRKRKIVADSSSSAASSPSSLSSSPDDTRFFCEVCNSRFEFHSNDFYRQATHYQSKGHKAKNVSYLKKRRSGM
jgi:hypothetical protein